MDPTVTTTSTDDRRRTGGWWILLIAGLVGLLYLGSWLATRYDGDGTAAPATTTEAPATTATPTTATPTTAAPTTAAPTTAAPTTAPSTTADPIDTSDQSIAALAVGLGTLGGALDAAGLLPTLDGDGPFTVFAPTTEAFASVDPDALETIASDPEGLLTPTLLHHVVEGSFDRDALSESGTTLTSLAGERLDLELDGDTLLVNGVRIADAEVVASNGVVFVIDAVLVPQQVSTALTALAITDLLGLEPIQFDDGSATIRPESIETLDRAVAILEADPEARVEIGGHTDDVGPADGNQRLSVRRAEAVRDYLIEAGIDEGRMTAVGYGEEQPIADNTTDEGRAANRRIEFTPLPAA